MSLYPITGLTNVKINDLAWLAGDWHGEDGDVHFDEHWSSPAGNSMMCMFRWIQGDQVRFYEFVSIEQEGEELVLRIKHFNPRLVGWEAKDDSVAFTLVQLERGKAVFLKRDAQEPLWMVYRLDSEDTLIACFENESSASKPSDEEFRFKRG